MADRQFPYWHVDAFSARAFGGNQAAVLICARGFPDDETMRLIAAENNFAETAFLVPPVAADPCWTLRWFTPACEVRLCGHATLAAGHVLLQQGNEGAIRFRTLRAGELIVRRTDKGYELGLPAIATLQGEHPRAVAALGVAPLQIARSPDGYSIFAYETEEQVRALQPDMTALAALGDEQFICTAPGRKSDIASRVFVPGAGVPEDSVTGSAHAALAPYWAARLGRDRFDAVQASPRCGALTCSVDGDRVWLGGPCTTVVTGTFCY